jgi:tartrate dehydratase beta subunit/fumarate hydratase class I family protein
MWHLRVKGFKVTVAMDAHGHSLYDCVQQQSQETLQQLLSQPLSL